MLLLKDSFSSISMHLQPQYLSKNTSANFLMNGETSRRRITRNCFCYVLDILRAYTRVIIRYAYSWQVEGSYNWKTLMDGYQECYHCT